MAADANRLVAALDYLERLKRQAAEFGSGVAGNLANRARSAGGLAYEALTSDPIIGRMTTAEFAQAADRPTPRLDQAARDIGTLGKAIVTQPIQTGKAIVQGEIERAQGAMQSPRAAGEYAGSFIDPARMAAALRKTAPIAELDVYHGTPHRFPATEANPLGEFDASKIGTGEGAQTFGHGIYLTQKPEIAEYYKNTIQADPQEFVDGEPFDDLNPNHLAAFYAAQHIRNWGRFDPEEVAKFAERGVGEPYQQAAALLRQSKFGKYTETEPGTVYKADLPDEIIDRMLDWDKPLSEQPAAIKNLFPTLEEARAIDAEMIRLSEATLAANDINGPAQAAWEAMYKSPQYKMAKIVVDEADPKLGKKIANGQRIYRAISGGDDKASAEQLRSLGIPGIKYLDAGSRGQGGSGTRNFVVFPGEEKKVRILERK